MCSMRGHLCPSSLDWVLGQRYMGSALGNTPGSPCLVGMGGMVTAKVELLFQAGAAGAGRVKFPAPSLLII